MENLIIYMIKACGLIAVFYLAYHTLLKKETFFGPNRWFLLAGLFTAVTLPLVVYTKTIWLEPVPSPIAGTQMRTIDLSKLIRYQQLVEKHSVTEPVSINWYDVIGGMYLAGVLLFFIRFVLDFISIRRILSGNIIIKDGRFRLIDSEKARSPFSFFNYIVYNSAQLKQEELASIIEHEKVHSGQRHSMDMIISQLFCIAFWFNPFVWLYKKSISQNLEFIADAAAIRITEDRQAYQKTLLKITVQPDCIGLTNHFYQSLIKKRIVMLNKERSNQMNYWKYVTVLPVLAAFLLLFQVKVVAQEKGPAKRVFKVTPTAEKISIEINKDTKDSELDEKKKTIKEEYNADVNYENVVRNLNSEITGIKVTVKDKGQSQVYEVAGNSPITPFTIDIEKNASGRTMITFGTGGNNGDYMMARAFRIDSDDANDSLYFQEGENMRSFGLSDISPLSPMEPGMPARGYLKTQDVKIGDTDMLIVINGTKQKKGNSTVIQLPLGHEMAEMNILKAKDAKKKYGKEAKEGAIEITTRRSNDMAMMMGPETFDFHIRPDIQIERMPIPMDFDILIERFDDLKNNGDFFGNGTVEYGGLSEEEMKQIQEELKKSHIELQNLRPQLEEKFRMKELSREELNDANQEIQKAKKEIEESRKEIEKARIELEKARKALNKKV